LKSGIGWNRKVGTLGKIGFLWIVRGSSQREKRAHRKGPGREEDDGGRRVGRGVGEVEGRTTRGKGRGAKNEVKRKDLCVDRNGDGRDRGKGK